MSGDVQPRKRKDKRRKKESSSLGNIHEPLPGQKFRQKSEDESEEPPVIGSTDQGENIHIHNDHGIGGNVCVKIIFFCLLAALVGLVGVIFIQSRGSTDVDLPSIEDSRFAEYFTGFLDDAGDDHGHDDHDVALQSGEEDHEDHGDDHDEHDEEDEDDEHDEHDEEEEEDDEHGSEEPAQQSTEQDDDKDEADDDNDDDEDDDDGDADADADADDDDDDNAIDVRQKANDNDNDNDNDDDDDEDEENDDDADDADDDGLPARDEQPPSEEEEDEPPPPPPRRSGQSQPVSTERRTRGPQGIEEEKAAPNLPQIDDGNDDDDKDEGNDDEKNDTNDNDDDDDNDDNDDNDDEGINVSGPDENDLLDDKLPDEDDDWVFRQELDFADDQFDNNPKVALEKYEAVLTKKPTSLRALMGKAKALDKIAEMERSNRYLRMAIAAYKQILLENGERVPNKKFEETAERCINRMRFGGDLESAIAIHKALITKFPNVPKHRNDLAVTYLILNRIDPAKRLLNETLSIWPDNGFALVHYGFILKTSDNNMKEGVEKMMAGIRTKEPGVIDGRFFFHLGDALNRLGRGKEAIEWYDLGVKEKLFLSRYQRSLYNVDRLKGQPWWTQEETTYQKFFKNLENNWQKIRAEGLALLNAKGVNLFKDEAENLKDTGDWKQLDLFFRGKKHANCNKAPVTCSLIGAFPPAATCTRGQAKFSVMLPNTHVWPHCGPTNCRLRSHLGLVVPKNTYLRVAEDTRSWEEGKVFVFDDSFEHEVWHNGTGARLVLIVDVWHPELTMQERQYLAPI